MTVPSDRYEPAGNVVKIGPSTGSATVSYTHLTLPTNREV